MTKGKERDWSNIPLGKKSDGAIAREFDIPSSTVTKTRRRLGIAPYKEARGERETFDWDSLPLGEKSDVEIAREHGLKSASVSSARRRRGIPCFVEEGKTRPDRSKKQIEWDEQPLGKMPDRVLQRRLGLASVSSVSGARRRRMIPQYKPPSQKELVETYFEMQAQWDSLEAVEARYKELVALAGDSSASESK